MSVNSGQPPNQTQAVRAAALAAVLGPLMAEVE